MASSQSQTQTYEQLPTAESGAKPEPKDAAPPAAPVSTLQKATSMGIWIVLSNITILFNKWLIDNAGFGYPIILTCWHLTFASIVTQILARTTKLLDSRHKLPINGRFYMRTILPIGIVSSGTIVCSNYVYLYLSVAFIQMLKSAAPAIVLFISWSMGAANPTVGNITTIMVIVAGVALASVGEIAFSWVGLLFQLGSIVFEAIRVVLIQIMLSGDGLKMEAMVGLYYFAPVCAVMNAAIALVIEVPGFKWQDLQNVGIPLLVLNAAVAFLLNFSGMLLIGQTSGLVKTLTGIFKNILIIAVSVVIWGTQITVMQVIGYTISLLGLVYYSFGYEKIAAAFQTAREWTTSTWEALPAGKAANPAVLRRLLVIGAAIIISCALLYLGYKNNPFASTYSGAESKGQEAAARM